MRLNHPRSTSPRRLLARALVLACIALALPGAARGAEIEYRTVFQDPGANPVQDLSLERHAVDLIAATPAGEHITFAFRDFNRQPVADALIAAHRRGVSIDGVIDGGERSRSVVQALRGAVGADRVVLCGSPTFRFHSCIAASPEPSLQHNKFMTFSRLADGREHVVLQTSKNFFGPSQLSYYNDMVEIGGDVALHAAYVKYVGDMKTQLRSDTYYFVTDGDGGRNTMYPSPRPQSDPETDDTIAERMDEIDCSAGGSPSGRGLVRIANMAFRSERAVILGRLLRLEREGCDIEIVLSNADGDILSGLVSAGIPVHPFFLRAAGSRPQVIVHDKFWLVDAKSTVTGERRRLSYVGSSNWRGDQQYSDDMLLRIADDGVHAAYSAYWELIASRAASDQNRPASDDVAPAAALTASPPANGAGWNRSDVAVRVAASDGHNVAASGLDRLHVEMSGAQTGSWDLSGETSGYRVADLVVSAEGVTTVTYFALDRRGNAGAAKSFVVRIDRTPPALAGLPRDCELWPPNHEMVHVADVTGDDGGSGLDGLFVSASSDGTDDDGDIAISGGSVDLRAEKSVRGGARVYEVNATAVDRAGNHAAASGMCTVPHSRGRPGSR